MEFTYLAAQTFGDPALERELLELFLDQGRRLIPTLATLDPQQQSATAHHLKGSARAVGATALAASIEAYEQAEASMRHAESASFAAVATSFEATEAAILAHLHGSPATAARGDTPDASLCSSP